jgi:hypothetical protein
MNDCDWEVRVGKRSDFKRRPRDFYETPLEAVRPLIPFLNGTKRYAEPCAGKGALIKHLSSYGLRCGYKGDISDGRDALARNSYGHVDAIITNPPHARELMHKLILHFQEIVPAWLLIDLDWVANLQAVPFLPHCSDIVIIGRVKWIKNTPHTGKENYAWFRFDGGYDGPTRIHNHRGLLREQR